MKTRRTKGSWLDEPVEDSWPEEDAEMKAKPTKGPMHVFGDANGGQVINARGITVAEFRRSLGDTIRLPETMENAHLTSAAFNAASEVEALGLDGRAAIEALAGLLNELIAVVEVGEAQRKAGDEYITLGHDGPYMRQIRALLAKAKGEK